MINILPNLLVFPFFSKVIVLRLVDIVILEQYHETRKLQLPQNGYIYYRTNLKTITFEKNGNTNKFGSIFINLNETVYRTNNK